MARIRLVNYINDGVNYLSFIYVREGDGVNIATGCYDSPNDTCHEMLFELGKDGGLFSGRKKPDGGGVFKRVSDEYQYERDSHGFGEPEGSIIRFVEKRFRRE